MKHIAIYMRVSTNRQDTLSQEPDLKRWVEAFCNGEQVVWYEDQYRGTTMDRPAWNQIEEGMTLGKVSKVVVWRMDRLGRTAAGLTALFEEFTRLNIGFESLRDKVDLSTPAGRLLANVLASVAAYESEVRTERINAGIAAAHARGKRWGGSKPGRMLKVTHEQLDVIRKMHREGETKTTMAKATGLARSTIYNLLDRIITQ